MSGCMEDTSLQIASFSSDRLDGPIDTREISNIPTTRSPIGVNLEINEKAMVPAAPANDSVFPERLYQECLNRVSSVPGCSILHERDIRNLTSLTWLHMARQSPAEAFR
ncbi:hypothetical protein TNCV_3741951 [Trichonephila clavipes]|nr:hypothetical protein TNCV_3741951 [Trichonephila clavipes]